MIKDAVSKRGLAAVYPAVGAESCTNSLCWRGDGEADCIRTGAWIKDMGYNEKWSFSVEFYSKGSKLP